MNEITLWCDAVCARGDKALHRLHRVISHQRTKRLGGRRPDLDERNDFITETMVCLPRQACPCVGAASPAPARPGAAGTKGADKLNTEQWIETLLSNGADHAAVIPVEEIVFSEEFRKACEVNLCGGYGKCWMCPPDIGPIDELMREAKTYRQALVYQTISPLEDSYDIEGMEAACRRHSQLTLQFKKATVDEPLPHLHLGAGGCHICPRCAKADEEPCRFPELAIPSLEAYGIHVSSLAQSAGMKYINGANTVTYFGAMLFGQKD